MSVISVRKLTKTYGEGDLAVQAVRDVDLDVEAGEVLLAVPDSQTIIKQLAFEHQEIRAAIGSLEAEAGLGKLIFDLGDLLERHIRKEERELFPLFEQNADLFDVETVSERITNILGSVETSPG